MTTVNDLSTERRCHNAVEKLFQPGTLFLRAFTQGKIMNAFPLHRLFQITEYILSAITQLIGILINLLQLSFRTETGLIINRTGFHLLHIRQ